MTLENLIGKGLQHEPTNAAEIRRFLDKIATKLDDAHNDRISLDKRFDVACEALLQVGLAALRANGFRPDSRGGHHVLALQTLNQTIDYPQEKLRLLDEFRRQRAAGLYDGSFAPSHAEVQAILETLNDLKLHLERWRQTGTRSCSEMDKVRRPSAPSASARKPQPYQHPQAVKGAGEIECEIIPASRTAGHEGLMQFVGGTHRQRAAERGQQNTGTRQWKQARCSAKQNRQNGEQQQMCEFVVRNWKENGDERQGTQNEQRGYDQRQQCQRNEARVFFPA